jgi:hypothetical protein
MVLRNTGNKVNPWGRNIVEKIIVSQVVNKFPIFYGIRNVITAFTRARNLPLSFFFFFLSTTARGGP